MATFETTLLQQGHTAGIEVPAPIAVTLTLDTAPRTVEVPDDLA